MVPWWLVLAGILVVLAVIPFAVLPVAVTAVALFAAFVAISAATP